MNLGGVFTWYRGQRLDEELFGGHQALLTEGLPPSMGLFMVGLSQMFAVNSAQAFFGLSMQAS